MNLLALASLFILIILFFIFKFQGRSIRDKIFFKKHFSHFELCDDNESLALFLNHQNQAKTKIPLNNVISSEISLNDEVINLITTHQAFDNTQEQKTYHHFDQEYRYKMIDKRIRKITLELQDSYNKKYQCCLYLREGNQRLTRYKYQDVVKNLMAWSWLISSDMESRGMNENSG